MLSKIVTVPICLKYTTTFLTVKEKVQKTVFHLIASFHNSSHTSTAGFDWIQIEVNLCQNVLCSLQVGVNVVPLWLLRTQTEGVWGLSNSCI